MTWMQKKIPAQQWLEPQAIYTLGICHGSCTLTASSWDGTSFYILPYLNISDFLWLKGLFSVTLCHQGPAKRQKPVEQGDMDLNSFSDEIDHEAIQAWANVHCQNCLSGKYFALKATQTLLKSSCELCLPVWSL